MQVLLTTLNAKYIHSNLAVRILYQLNKDYNGLSWKEFTIKQDKDEIAEFCSKFDVVAFSCYIWNIVPTLEVIKIIKALNPDIKILLGGPEVSYEYEDIIARPEIDFIIKGEGETAFSEFLSNYPHLGLVSGLIWKKGGEIKTNPEAALFDLKKLSDIQPYADDPPETLRTKVLYIETSRGCPYKCEFCLASLDNKVRYLPEETIKANLLYLMEHGKVIKFLDRTFNIKRDFTISVFRFILENYRPGNVFQFEITADILHPDIIKFINEEAPPGLFRFEIGIQTVNREANLAVSRRQDFNKTKSIIRQVEDKVELHLDLIVGLPLDRFSDIKYSFEEVFKLFAPELQLGFLKFLKGTPVRDKHNAHGYVYAAQAPYEIIRSNYLSENELDQIRFLENALEIYWNGNKARRTLRYVCENYGIFDFLLELGKYFISVRNFHKYSLNDVYDILLDFVKKNYPEDIKIAELVALDYYLYPIRKPQLKFIPELEPGQKSKLVASLPHSPEKCRHIAIPISFSFAEMEEQRKSIPQPQILVIRYTGFSKPEVFHFNMEVTSSRSLSVPKCT